MKRINNPFTLGEHSFYEHERKYKTFDESITDKSCFTTLTDQLKHVAPMTQEEINSHYDFIKGSKDNGKTMPLRRGSDIAELQADVRSKQKNIKEKIDRIASEELKKAKIKAEIASLKAPVASQSNNS